MNRLTIQQKIFDNGFTNADQNFKEECQYLLDKLDKLEKDYSSLLKLSEESVDEYYAESVESYKVQIDYHKQSLLDL